MGEADINPYMRLRNQLVFGEENFSREKKLSLVQTSSFSKYLQNQLLLDHELVDAVACVSRKICVTLLRYVVEEPKRLYDLMPV